VLSAKQAGRKIYVWQLLPIPVAQNGGMQIRQGVEQAHLRVALFVDGGGD